MTITLEYFRQVLFQGGLIGEDELDSLLNDVPAEERPQTPETLSEFLVNNHFLTTYQAKKLLQGKQDELRLGNYVIQNLIRRGAMGEVYRARHPRMRRDVALKVILTKLSEDPECVARFHREVRLAARLNHPNIVTAYDAAEDHGRLFLVMEYIEGKDLKTIINKHGAVSLEDAVDYITQAARGLKYAHSRGVIHRDIKPSNLLLDSTGTIKILDVGLAIEECERNDSDLTVAGGLLGSVNYMAPEQARDARDADARSDIYSLGCTLWYLLSGSIIYQEKTVINRILAHRERPVPDLESLGEDIPPELQMIFRRMVAKHPDDRYQSIAELLEDLEQLQLILTAQERKDDCEHFCENCGETVQEAEQIRLATDSRAIELPDEIPDAIASEDPTYVNYHSENFTPPEKSTRLQTALIVIGGFSLGCLVMVVANLLENGQTLDMPPLRAGNIFGWLFSDSDSEKRIHPGPVIPEPPIDQTPKSDTSTSGKAAEQVAEANRAEVGLPPAADFPFSPAEARAHQQRWAKSLRVAPELTTSLGITLKLIPPGTYQMGSSTADLTTLIDLFPNDLLTLSKQFNNEMPQHGVTLTRAYYISAQLVTFEQFEQFVAESGYQLQQATQDGWNQLGSNRTPEELRNLPVRYICWNDAAEFCHWLSAKEGRSYRLPTEAEWEYASRAGSQEVFGGPIESLREQEWWKDNANWPRPVGSKAPNAFGLFDIRGNLREFCGDYYSRYSASPQKDPLGSGSDSNDARVVRGGGASSKMYEIRPARRSRVAASDAVVSYVGFRVVVPVNPTSETRVTSNLAPH